MSEKPTKEEVLNSFERLKEHWSILEQFKREHPEEYRKVTSKEIVPGESKPIEEFTREDMLRRIQHQHKCSREVAEARLGDIEAMIGMADEDWATIRKLKAPDS